MRLTLQHDGNLVTNSGNNTTLWQTWTAGTAADRLIMQNDGNLVLYTAAGQPLWSTGTCCR